VVRASCTDFPPIWIYPPALGQETTQLCVGLHDLQFSFGAVSFAIQSRVELFRDGTIAAILAAAWGDNYLSAYSRISPGSQARLLAFHGGVLMLAANENPEQ
jgi:hypothetical protein